MPEVKLAECTGLIRIVKIPEGEAPLVVRRAWVGLILPCYPILGFTGDNETGVLSRKKLDRNRIVFSVPQRPALAALKKHRPSAAKWHEDLGFPIPGKFFCFAEDEAEILHGITRQQIVEVSDEMRGDPSR